MKINALIWNVFYFKDEYKNLATALNSEGTPFVQGFLKLAYHMQMKNKRWKRKVYEKELLVVH